MAASYGIPGIPSLDLVFNKTKNEININVLRGSDGTNNPATGIELVYTFTSRGFNETKITSKENKLTTSIDLGNNKKIYIAARTVGTHAYNEGSWEHYYLYSNYKCVEISDIDMASPNINCISTNVRQNRETITIDFPNRNFISTDTDGIKFNIRNNSKFSIKAYDYVRNTADGTSSEPPITLSNSTIKELVNCMASDTISFSNGADIGISEESFIDTDLLNYEFNIDGTTLKLAAVDYKYINTRFRLGLVRSGTGVLCKMYTDISDYSIMTDKCLPKVSIDSYYKSYIPYILKNTEWNQCIIEPTEY